MLGQNIQLYVTRKPNVVQSGERVSPSRKKLFPSSSKETFDNGNVMLLETSVILQQTTRRHVGEY
jgi:hypothetical protein